MTGVQTCALPISYGGNPSTDPSDRLRVWVGDLNTSTATEWMSDTEYDFIIAQASNQYIQAQLAANTLSAVFAGPSGSGEDWTERKVGDLVIKRSEASDIADDFRALAVRYGSMAAAGVSPYSGGRTISDKNTVEDDTDRVRPAFTRKLFDNARAIDAVGASTST